MNKIELNWENPIEIISEIISNSNRTCLPRKTIYIWKKQEKINQDQYFELVNILKKFKVWEPEDYLLFMRDNPCFNPFRKVKKCFGKGQKPIDLYGNSICQECKTKTACESHYEYRKRFQRDKKNE